MLFGVMPVRSKGRAVALHSHLADPWPGSPRTTPHVELPCLQQGRTLDALYIQLRRLDSLTRQRAKPSTPSVARIPGPAMARHSSCHVERPPPMNEALKLLQQACHSLYHKLTAALVADRQRAKRMLHDRLQNLVDREIQKPQSLPMTMQAGPWRSPSLPFTLPTRLSEIPLSPRRLTRPGWTFLVSRFPKPSQMPTQLTRWIARTGVEHLNRIFVVGTSFSSACLPCLRPFLPSVPQACAPTSGAFVSTPPLGLMASLPDSVLATLCALCEDVERTSSCSTILSGIPPSLNEGSRKVVGCHASP